MAIGHSDETTDAPSDAAGDESYEEDREQQGMAGDEVDEDAPELTNVFQHPVAHLSDSESQRFKQIVQETPRAEEVFANQGSATISVEGVTSKNEDGACDKDLDPVQQSEAIPGANLGAQEQPSNLVKILEVLIRSFDTDDQDALSTLMEKYYREDLQYKSTVTLTDSDTLRANSTWSDPSDTSAEQQMNDLIRVMQGGPATSLPHSRFNRIKQILQGFPGSEEFFRSQVNASNTGGVLSNAGDEADTDPMKSSTVDPGVQLGDLPARWNENIFHAEGHSNRNERGIPFSVTASDELEVMKWLNDREGDDSVSAFDAMTTRDNEEAFHKNAQPELVTQTTGAEVDMPGVAYASASSRLEGEPI